MKTEKTKISSGKESELNFKSSTEPYEIIYADPRDEEIHLKILKSARINAHMARWFLEYEYSQLLWSDGIFEILELDARKYGANYKTFLEVIHPDDREIKIQAQNDLKKTKNTIEISYRLLLNNGRIKWINEICNTDFDKDGHPIRSFGTIQDITKYKLSEEISKQNEERFRSLIESIPSGIAIIQNNKFEFINPAGIRILGGNNSNEIKGKAVTRFISPKSKSRILKKLKTITLGKPEPPFEQKLIRFDGSELDVEITLIGTVFQGSGAIQIIIDNISERKKTEVDLRKSEEKFRSMASSISDVIWTIDIVGNLTYVSPSIDRLLGYSPDEVIGNHFSSLLCPDSAKFALNVIGSSIQSVNSGKKTRPKKFVAESICKNGKTRWIEITANPMFDSKQTFTGFTGISQDITDRKKADQLLKENETHLKELIETKDKFFSLIAHDLRTPFNSIIGFLELLINNYDEISEIEKKNYLSLVHKDANKTLNLLDNLLEWAKSQTGNISFHARNLNLLSVVNNIEKTFESALKLKQLRLQISIPERLKIFADLNMMTAIIQNLISNSIKFSQPGNSIAINATHKKSEIEIEVSDHGIGMNETITKNLFSINKEDSKLGTASEKGSGLGLILCKDFVERHHGTIQVKSEPGKGSQFLIRIPDKF